MFHSHLDMRIRILPPNTPPHLKLIILNLQMIDLSNLIVVRKSHLLICLILSQFVLSSAQILKRFYDDQQCWSPLEYVKIPQFSIRHFEHNNI